MTNATNANMTGAGAQNNGGCSRENGVEQGQNAGISRQETLAMMSRRITSFLIFLLECKNPRKRD